MSYTKILQRYPLNSTLAMPCESLVLWLTGQSSFRHSHLATEQQQLLDAFALQGWTTMKSGFPYNAEAISGGYDKPSLLAASLRNTWQFMAATWNLEFQKECARHLQPVLNSVSNRLVLLCGSCGLQLFVSSLPWLQIPSGLTIHLMALGPVGHRIPLPAQIKISVIKGSRDWISTLFSNWPADAWISGGHMAYAARPETWEAIQRLYEGSCEP